jgi:hypothetical protein
MILFYVEDDTCHAKSFYERFKKETNLPVALISHTDFIMNSQLESFNKGNQIITKIKMPGSKSIISTEDIKIIYFSQYPNIYQSMIAFENELDISYAVQEWTATITSVFVTRPEIKMINTIWPPYDLVTEMEQVLLMQQMGIKTIELFITNNTQKVKDYYSLWDKQVLYKTVRAGYDTAAMMEMIDLNRLDKLTLSPASFQKLVNGKEISICQLGKKFLVVETYYDQEIREYIETVIPEALTESLIKMERALNIPCILYHFIYDEDEDDYFAYNMNIYPTFDMLKMLFGESFEKLLTSYLLEEYNR